MTAEPHSVGMGATRIRLSLPMLLVLLTLTLPACNPFYSVEQSDIERGYRWIGRRNYDSAINTFEATLKKHPQSGLAHVGLGDAMLASRRPREAIAAYDKAVAIMLVETKPAVQPGTASAQVVGKLPFSYQNQGLAFPYGVEAYLYMKRALAYEALAKDDTSGAAQLRERAAEDYTAASRAAPDWDEPKERLKCSHITPRCK